jgi:hypothetical protein
LQTGGYVNAGGSVSAGGPTGGRSAPANTCAARSRPGWTRWLRFAIGVAGLAGFFWFLTTRPLPPGAAGEIIHRNLREDVQATALFYADLERMPAIEKTLPRR